MHSTDPRTTDPRPRTGLGRRTRAGRASSAAIQRADVVRLRGSVPIEHTLAKRGAEKLWNLVNTEPFVNTLGALTGNQAMQQVKAGLKAIYLSGWQVAGDANIAGEMYPDQSLYPVELGADGRQAHQQHLHARRPDPVVRRQGRHRLLRADRRRCRSRLRRRAQRVRADEVDDRGRRRRRPLRGPARLGEEVRPHGRQGAGADARSRRQAHRRAPGRRRDGHADARDRPHRRRSRRPGDQRRRRQRQAVPAPASARSKASTAPSPGLEQAISRGLAYARVRRHGLVRDRQARPGLRQGLRRGDPRASSRASCWPTTARRASTGRRTSTTRRSPSSSASSARWATSSSSSRWPASTA